MRHFTSVQHAGNIDALVSKALRYKQQPLADSKLGAGKRMGLLFLNPSMRTRISTQIAARNLGMDVIVLNMDKDGWKLELEEDIIMNGTTVEHIKDAAPVLGSYFDILALRSFPQLQNKVEDYKDILLNQLIKYAGIPIVSMESNTLHPLQSLADVITIMEQRKNKIPKVVLAWAPHIKPIPQCVANSFAEWMSAWDAVDLVITHPEGYELDDIYSHNAIIEYDQHKALRDADFVYVKNWSSVSQYGQLPGINADRMITPQHLAGTANACVMHCLPVRRDVELSSAVLDSANSLVQQQAANRVWATQAVLSEILKNL